MKKEYEEIHTEIESKIDRFLHKHKIMPDVLIIGKRELDLLFKSADHFSRFISALPKNMTNRHTYRGLDICISSTHKVEVAKI